jgi:GNAT superfamily N-acetyltransferase
MRHANTISEAIEREALVSLHGRCPPAVREALGLELIEVGDALVALASEDPSILLNRTLGLGSSGTVDTQAIEEIAEIYRSRGIGRYFLHVYESQLDDAGIDALARCELERARGWMKFRRDAAPSPEPHSDLRLVVAEAGSDIAQHAGRIVAAAFGMSEAAGPLLAGLAEDSRWRLVVSCSGDEPAGAGAVFIDHGAAWLEWGATDPAFRRRGSQGAIMAARIEMALAAGCEHLFTETGEAAAGDPQHSYGNIQKAGFRETVLRANYAPKRKLL